MTEDKEARAELELKRSRRVQRKRKRSKRERWKLFKAARDAFRRRRAITRTRRRRLERIRAGAGPAAAIRWAAAKVGTREDPPGSNRGPGITTWQQRLGSWLVGQAWCGTFVGNALLAAGVKITSRVAGVALIEDDARAGQNGFAGWFGATSGRPGDAVVLFGRGVHVELVVSRQSWGYETIGGNTSCEGCTGSQSDGGMVARRKRTFSVVRGIARPAY